MVIAGLITSKNWWSCLLNQHDRDSNMLFLTIVPTFSSWLCNVVHHYFFIGFTYEEYNIYKHISNKKLVNIIPLLPP